MALQGRTQGIQFRLVVGPIVSLENVGRGGDGLDGVGFALGDEDGVDP